MWSATRSATIRAAMTTRALPSFLRASLLGAILVPCLCAIPSASASEWHPADVSGRTGVAATTEAQAAVLAQRYLKQPSLRLATVDLVQTRVLATSTHFTIRYAQSYRGLPVIGGQAAVRVGADGATRTAALNVERDLSVKITPSISSEVAAATVEKLLAAWVPNLQAASLGAELAVMPTGNGGLLVWQLNVPTARGTVRVFVDAHDSRMVGMRLLRLHANGRVYPISSVVTPATQDLELLELTASAPQKLNGWNGNFSVTNYVSGTSQSGYVVEQLTSPSLGEDFLYDPPAAASDATDAFAQVGIYYHLTRMRQFFVSNLSLDMSAASWRLVAVANALENGAPLDNAFFSPMGQAGAIAAPNLIAIGQGSTFDFAQDSDVFNHEFTHYVMHNAVGYNAGQIHADSYGLSPWSGSIDEGLSDYFSSTVNDDAIVGEASLALLSAARNLTDTTKSCPSNMLGEVHADGEIIGSVAWSIRIALGAAVADQLIWDAATLLTFGASFGDFATAITQSATDMLGAGTITQANLDAVKSILGDRGLDKCFPEIGLDESAPQSGGAMFGLNLVAQALGATCAQAQSFGVSLQSLFHYSVTPNSGDTELRLSVALNVQSTGSLKWKILGRQGQHVGFSPGQLLPVATEFDYSTADLQTENGELVINAESSPPFDPAKTYHFVIVHQNCPSAEVTLSVELSSTASSPDAGVDNQSDAGTNPEDGEGGGCGCKAGEGGSGGPTPWLVAGLGLVGLALMRRRRQS